MSCSASELNIEGFTAIQLANDKLQVDVLPQLGGRIWNLWHTSRGIQWIWHNPSVALEIRQFGDNYDDNWAGGWEELFPNDAVGEFMGRNLPDHGEWWSQKWNWEVTEQSPKYVCMYLWYDSLLTSTHCEKWIALESGSSRVSVRYRVTNRSREFFYFLFKQHLAVAVTPAHRLELSGGKVLPVDLEFGTRIGMNGPFEWPLATGRSGEIVDLSVLPPPEEKHSEFVYIAELPESWCGVRDSQTGAVLRLHFAPEVFPFTWLFMTFGGWRGLYTVVLEPCTNMPKDLDTAIRLGQSALLSANQVWECEISAEVQ